MIDPLVIEIFFTLGIVLSIVFPLTFILFWKRFMPPVLRTLFWATRRRNPLLLLCHDSGRSILTTITERQGEGIVLTAQGKYKILPRFAPKQPLGEVIQNLIRARLQALSAEEIEETEGKEAQPNGGQPPASQEPDIDQINPSDILPELNLSEALSLKVLKENFLLDYSDYVNKRSLLIGLDLPVFVGYTGKLCLLNPEALALYEAGDMLVRTNDLELFNPQNIAGKEKSAALQPMLLLNPRKIQEIIWKGFDQSQIAGVVADSEELERLRLAGGLSPKMKMLLMIVLIAGLAVAAVLFLPQILGGGQAKLIASLLRWG